MPFSNRFYGFTTLVVAIWTVSSAATCGQNRRDTNRAGTRLELAKDALKKNELESAEREATQALDFDGRSAEGHYLLGLVDYLRAINHFRLIEIDDCLTGADAQVLRDEFDGHLLAAQAHLETALSFDREYAEALAAMGSVAIQLQDYERAAALLSQALAIPHRLENIAIVRANLGWAHFHRRDYALANKELRQALQFVPDMCVANYRLGRVDLARQQFDKAYERFERVAADPTCALQEARLYAIQTSLEMGQRVDDGARDACVTMAPQSCVAARCRLAGMNSGQAADELSTETSP